MATRSGFKNGKCRKYVWIRNMLMSGWLTLLFLAGTVRGQGPAEQDAATKAVLKVTNAHFTRGQRYPSNYLTVFSDRRAECDTVEWSGQEAHVVKSKILTPEEFEHLTSILSDPELLGIKSRYESRRIILDSWMEWDVGIQRAGDFQKIAIINFSPTPYLQRTDIEPYPFALLRLGCFVWKLRDDVYGDEPGARDVFCQKALHSQVSAPPIHVDPHVEELRLTRQMMPVYPEAAETADIEGTVLFHVVIGKDGVVKSVDYVSGPRILVRSATAALKEWRYKPTVDGGVPVEVDTTVSLVFSLPH
ncbi:MAG: energy transducer TonB [Candidatus Acidiferrales bacterium]